MINRQSLIEECLQRWQPEDGDLIAYINSILVEEGHPQLLCVERRDALNLRETKATG